MLSHVQCNLKCHGVFLFQFQGETIQVYIQQVINCPQGRELPAGGSHRYNSGIRGIVQENCPSTQSSERNLEIL